jgi:hypothetical protein
MSPKEVKMGFVWDYFSTVEPVGDGDTGTVIVGEEDVKTLKCSLFVYTYCISGSPRMQVCPVSSFTFFRSTTF